MIKKYNYYKKNIQKILNKIYKILILLNQILIKKFKLLKIIYNNKQYKIQLIKIKLLIKYYYNKKLQNNKKNKF